MEKQSAKQKMLIVAALVVSVPVVVYGAYLLSKMEGGRVVAAAAIVLISVWVWVSELKKWKRA